MTLSQEEAVVVVGAEELVAISYIHDVCRFSKLSLSSACLLKSNIQPEHFCESIMILHEWIVYALA